MINSISFCLIQLDPTEPFFKKSINSILLQKVPDFEIIVFSSLANNEINDRHINFINSEGLKINSLNKVRNYLFTQAQKECIVFMDHFISLTPEWYKSIKQVNYYDIFSTRLILPSQERCLDWGIKKSEKILAPLNYEEWTNRAFINGALLIMKRKIMNHIQFNVNLASWVDDDVNFCRDAAEIGFRVGIIPEGIAVWNRDLDAEPFKKYLIFSTDNEIDKPKKKSLLSRAKNFYDRIITFQRKEKQAIEIPVVGQNIITVSSTMDTNPGMGPQGILTGKTIWHSQKPPKYPEWVEIKYAAPQMFTKFAIKPQDKSQQGIEYSRAPRDFILQASNDGKAWVNLIEVNNDLYKNSRDWHEWNFENKKAYSIYRLFITTGGSKEILTVQQIKLQ